MQKDIKAISHYVLEEAWNKGNFAPIDQFVSADYVLHDPNQQEVRGPEGAKQMISMFRAAIPDVHMTIEDQVAEGDKVVTRFTNRGTHTNSLMGIPPTGKAMTVEGIVVARFKDGKCVEEWANWDRLGMLQQIGVVPKG